MRRWKCLPSVWSRLRIAERLAAIPVFLALLLATPAGASLTTASEATDIASNWVQYLAAVDRGFEDRAVAGPIELARGDTLLGWAFSLTPTGYVVVSGLHELPPVVAYSSEHHYDASALGGIEALVADVLLDRFRRFAKANGGLDVIPPSGGLLVFDPGTQDVWSRLSQPEDEFRNQLRDGSAPAVRDAGPLLTTSWHQDAPFDALCPMGDGGRCAVGCVATAAAQIMRYYRWPPYGVGSHSYTWDGDQSCDGNVGGGLLSATFSDEYAWADMPDSVDAGWTQAEEDALSELCYEVGVAFEMDYGFCGSGAYTADGVVVFPTWFQYSDEIDREDRDEHTPTSWFAVVRTEVDEGRPMQYAFRFSATEGHSVVCDGWKQAGGEDFYHINYGWGGNNTAWFAVDNIINSYDPMQEYLIRHIAPEIAVVEVVDDSVSVGLFSSLALDGAGDLNVSYYDQDNSRLKLAERDGTWDVQILDDAGDVGEYSSLAISDDGRMNVSYYDASNGALKYTGWITDLWTASAEVVDGAGGGDVGEYSSLDLDDQGRLAVSYYDATNSALKLSLLDGVWQDETVDDLGAVGEHTCLAIDGSGRRNVSYYDASRGALKYSGWIADMWTASAEVVDGAGGGDVGEYSSLDLDDQGRLAVSYYDATNSALKLSLLDGVWQDETVDDLGAVGEHTCLAIDGSGRRNVSYYDASRGALKYSGWIADMWTASAEVVDGGLGGDNVGMYTSLAVDPEGRLAVAYYDQTNADLKHAVLDGVWQDEVVDSSADVGQYASLCIDWHGNRNISYYDAAATALKYAGWLPDATGVPSGDDPAAGDTLAIPTRFALYAPTPNPSTGSVRIQYDVPVPAGSVAITVFDVSGRLVSSHELGAIPAGRHVFTWSGRSGDGVPVSSGVYFYRLDVVGVDGGRVFTAAGKSVLIR